MICNGYWNYANQYTASSQGLINKHLSTLYDFEHKCLSMTAAEQSILFNKQYERWKAGNEGVVVQKNSYAASKSLLVIELMVSILIVSCCLLVPLFIQYDGVRVPRQFKYLSKFDTIQSYDRSGKLKVHSNIY